MRDGFPGDKPPHEVTMEHRGGGTMGTQPGVASGKADEGTNLVEFAAMGLHLLSGQWSPCAVREGLSQCCGFLFIGLFFPSSVDFYSVFPHCCATPLAFALLNGSTQKK